MVLTHTEWLAGVFLLFSGAIAAFSRSLRKHAAQRAR
jgi:hypothetical protein